MKRLVVIGALVLAVLGVTGPVQAKIGTIDQVPAATLLVPYFEVDLGNPNGVNTLFSINNASASATLVHVTLWSDLSVPTFAFNVYLTGYDLQTFNLRDIFVNGTFPATASDGQDPTDTISPQGQGLGQQDINYASCDGQLPLKSFAQVLAENGGNPAFDFKTHLQRAHTGLSSATLGNKCAAQIFGDNIARGYITVDTVNNCTLRLHGDAGYFGPGGTGDVTNLNILYGDYFYVNGGENFAQGNPMVAIEASPGPGTGAINSYPGLGDPRTTTPGNYTFYGRYTSWNAADNREPLATTFAARFLNGGPFSGGTDLIVWRDSKFVQAGVNCPAVNQPLVQQWYPLGHTQIVVFDETEEVFTIPPSPFSPQPPNSFFPFAAETQRISLNDGGFNIPFTFGWVYLNLNHTTINNNPPASPPTAQAWVTTVHSAEGRFSVGYNAVQLDNAVNPTTLIIPAGF